jgi:hypothetical protein
MKRFFSKILLLIIPFNLFGQDSPYKLNPWIDVPIEVVGAATSYIGLVHLNNKKGLDSAYVATLKPTDVNKFDRGATHTHRHHQLKVYADIFLYSSVVSPFVLLAEKKIRTDALKVGFLYLETMTIAANAYTWVIGSTHRIRPYLYDPTIPIQDKLNSKATNSFFAGHPFASASATFFAAKIFHDYNPGSKLRKYVWTAALAFPTTVAYFRYRNGEHFPTDILVGIPLGAAIGILVPHFHKVKNKTHVLIYPSYNGIAMNYRF